MLCAFRLVYSRSKKILKLIDQKLTSKAFFSNWVRIRQKLKKKICLDFTRSTIAQVILLDSNPIFVQKARTASLQSQSRSFKTSFTVDI